MSSILQKVVPTEIHRGGNVRLLGPPPAAADELEGLLALLVTDLEGFTTLVERLGDVAARSVVQQHDRLLRRCVRQRKGREVVHTGDGILAALRSVSAALLCATDIQRAMSAESRRHGSTPLRARMGLHAGEPLPEDDRLFGHCVNTVVRVCGKADAGRVLVTDVVKQLAQGRFSFPTGVVHQLKGITTPVCLYEFAWDRAL